MPAKVFLVPQRIEKEIDKLPIRIQDRVDKAFGRIKDNPIEGVKLHGRLSDYYKYKIGDYRVIYTFVAKESRVEVVRVEHRQGVYK